MLREPLLSEPLFVRSLLWESGPVLRKSRPVLRKL